MKKFLLVFLLLIFKNTVFGQAPNDCVNAIIVCGNGTFSSNANGPGSSMTEVSGCNGIEHNTVWLKITIAPTVVPGSKLGFDLIPSDPAVSVDFDFWVFDKNRSCTSLGTAVRCCVTNPVQAGLSSNLTGMNGTTLATTAWSGTGGNNLPYVQWLTVSPGETYYIAIDRPYTTPTGNNGFSIVWSGNATNGAGAFPIAPTANTIPDYLQCSSSDPNISIFDFNTVKGQINSDSVSNNITFHTTLANAVDGVSPLPTIYSNTSNPQKIYARVTSKVGGCYSISEFNLKVFPLPTASISLSDTQICSGKDVVVTFTGTPGASVDYTVDGNPATAVLDTNGKFILTETPLANRTYALSMAKIIDGNNVVVCSQSLSDTQTVTVNAVPTVSGTLLICVGETTQLSGTGTPNTANPWTSSNTAVATVSSTGLVSGVTGGASDITYTDTNGCSVVSTVTVNPQPTITGNNFVCVTFSTQLTGSGTPAASNPWTSSNPALATVDSTGLVSGIAEGAVTITYTDINGCSTDFNMSVGSSNSTQSATAEVTNYFENQTITVTVVGDASYLFSLDGGPVQTSNVFHNVSAGLHKVTVTDTQGCTNIILDNILVIGYPHFFTPNGDGQNDTWNIWSLTDTQPNSEIRLFDRFGKLLKVITPGGDGWDGTYNGYALPSTDYWFTVRYTENGVEKLFKSHFTMKR